MKAAARVGEAPLLGAIRKAWTRYVLLLAGLVLVVFVATMFYWPWVYALTFERVVFPWYEAPFGFRGGTLAVGTGEERHTIYALVRVVPDGKLARAGARPGDVPISFREFYEALEQARAGRGGQFRVVAHADWPHLGKGRTLVLPPELPRP